MHEFGFFFASGAGKLATLKLLGCKSLKPKDVAVLKVKNLYLEPGITFILCIYFIACC